MALPDMLRGARGEGSERDGAVPDATQAAAFLQQLAGLEKTDPEEFDRIMSLLEKQAKEAAIGGQEGATQASPLQRVVQDQLRATAPAAAWTDQESVYLPGGRGKLGPSGVTGGKDQQQGVEMWPEPGFVLKTYIDGSEGAKKGAEGAKTKVFINVCESALIGEPCLKKKLDDDGKEVEGMNVPVSVGLPRVSTDKSGKESLVYDVVVNPKVIKEAEEDKTGSYRDFLCQLSITYVENKYKVAVSRKYKLPKLKYQGEIVSQMVRDDRKAPKIQEVASSNAAKTKPRPKTAPIKASEPLRDFESVRVCVCQRATDPSSPDDEGQKHQWLDAADITEPLIDAEPLPHAMNVVVKGVTAPPAEQLGGSVLLSSLSVWPYLLSLSLPGHTPRDILLPYPCTPERTQATLHAHERELRIALEVDTTPYEAGPDPGSKPWLLAQALRDEQKEAEDRAAAAAAVDAEDGGEKREERFHLQNKNGHDGGGGGSGGHNVQHTHGRAHTQHAEEDFDESTELPEDRFHKADFMSQHILVERERGRTEKADRWTREREGRGAKGREGDVDVEYVDVDDFKPGGRCAPTSSGGGDGGGRGGGSGCGGGDGDGDGVEECRESEAHTPSGAERDAESHTESEGVLRKASEVIMANSIAHVSHARTPPPHTHTHTVDGIAVGVCDHAPLQTQDTPGTTTEVSVGGLAGLNSRLWAELLD